MPPIIHKPAPVTPVSIQINDEEFPVVEVRATGDIILDVTFESTGECSKSIPSAAIRLWRASNGRDAQLPSPRVLYRVRLETLKKKSRYFGHLLGPMFAEGAVIKDTFSLFPPHNLDPFNINSLVAAANRIIWSVW